MIQSHSYRTISCLTLPFRFKRHGTSSLLKIILLFNGGHNEVSRMWWCVAPTRGCKVTLGAPKHLYPAMGFHSPPKLEHIMIFCAI